jgi:peptidoglycan/LPS O-acetylase OafA/YrhL
MIPIPAYYFALNAVLWSVSAEAFFYLVFPALDRGLSTTRGRVLLVAIPFIVGMLVIAMASHLHIPYYSASAFNKITGHGLVYISPLSRLKEFMIGMLAGGLFLKMRHQIRYPPSKLILFSLIEALSVAALIWGLSIMQAVSNPKSLPSISGTYFSQSLMAIFFAWVILVFAIQGGLFSRLLSLKALVIGGEISFSIYLFHQIFISWQYYNPWFLGWCPFPCRFPLLIVFTSAVSYGVWRWFERPMRTWTRRAFDHT